MREPNGVNGCNTILTTVLLSTWDWSTITIDKFEDIIVLQKVKELTLLISKSFQSSKEFACRGKIQYAAISEKCTFTFRL